MMFLATFFPTSDMDIEQFDLLSEFLKTTVDLVDVVGLHLIMSKIAGKGQLKFMIAGVGWSSAELLATGFWPLWTGARGIEFDWKYIQMSLDSNISLIQHISTAALVWLYSRKDLNKSSIPIVILLLGLSCYRPLIVEVLIHAVGFGSWTLLLMKSLLTAIVGLLSLQMFVSLTTGKDSNAYY
jgi:hypothetical protein